ncbi:DUF2306 domain-containing protein [Chitinimonas sp.]|uniref:DUF2306 domain-containing protein n=1 Tax=Chitinimonas sp. TaxID=1934313 RepID=UPI0035AE5675
MARHNASFYLMAFLCVGVAAYAFVAYTLVPLGAVVHPLMRANFETHRFGIELHIFASVLALLSGPFQFSASLRASRPQLHRWLGRLYLGGGVLVGGLAGLWMAQFAYGGVTGRLGFACLAVLWLFTGAMAYVHARARSFAAHRRWMVINFALTLAAVTLRLYLPMSMLARIDFDLAYPAIAWLCWVPNLLLAWLYLRSRPQVQAS